MSRKLRTNLPVPRDTLKPVVPDPSLIREREEKLRERTQRNYDQHHGVRELEPLSSGQSVWIPDRGEEAQVLQEAGTYEVQTSEGGVYHRNRRALVDLPNSESIETTETGTDLQEHAAETQETTHTNTQEQPRRSSRQSQAPERLDTSWTTGHSQSLLCGNIFVSLFACSI